MCRKSVSLYILFISLVVAACRSGNTGTGNGAGEPGEIYASSLKGKDSNRGTKRKPVRTISEINRRIRVSPHNIFFAGGERFDGTLIIENTGQADASPLFISSYGEGRAIINGGNQQAVIITRSVNLRIKNIDLVGNGRKDGNTTNGLSMISSSGSIVENVHVEGFQKSGVDLYDCRNINILGVTAENNGFSGINVMGSSQDSSENILIQDCRADNNPGDPTRLDNHSGNGILIGMSDSVIIDHCTATNNGWDMPRQGNGPVGIWAWMSDHVKIQYCISYRNRTSKGGKDGGGFDLDGGVSNSIIQYCLSYGNEGAGYGLFQYPGASGWSGNVIRYCVSINDGGVTEGSGGFFIWNGSGESDQLKDCYIYNNVVYSEKAPVISFENDSPHLNFTFCNNIFIGAGNIISGKNTGSSFHGNVWWSLDGKSSNFSSYASFKDWLNETNQETKKGSVTDIWSDPLLMGPFTTEITDPYKLSELTGYMLKPESKMVSRGMEIGSFEGFERPQHDFYGNSLPVNGILIPGIHQAK